MNRVWLRKTTMRTAGMLLFTCMTAIISAEAQPEHLAGYAVRVVIAKRLALIDLLWPPCVADTDIIFCPVVPSIFFLSSFLAQSQPSQIGCLPQFHTWCGLSANIRCRSDTCCTRLAEIQDAKSRQKSPSGHHRTTLSDYIFATEARIDNGKKTC